MPAMAILSLHLHEMFVFNQMVNAYAIRNTTNLGYGKCGFAF